MGLPVSGTDIEQVTVASVSPGIEALSTVERSELVRDLRFVLA